MGDQHTDRYDGHDGHGGHGGGARPVTVAAIQMGMGEDPNENIATAERLVRRAAAEGAQIIVLPELFERRYWCKDQDPAHFALAQPLAGHPTIERFAALAAALGVVLPISVYERDGQATFNTVVVADADGTLLGRYRKSHIPDGPGYQEKFYFNPGDSGFVVFRSAYAALGVAICWDQWFPEAARCLALEGAELLLYPSAIGSEPADPEADTSGHWQRVMCGHAGANLVPVVAANRVGTETGVNATVTFYGSSFVADATGHILSTGSRDGEGIVTATFDLTAVATQRAAWGIFRDRRPDLYRRLLAP